MIVYCTYQCFPRERRVVITKRFGSLCIVLEKICQNPMVMPMPSLLMGKTLISALLVKIVFGMALQPPKYQFCTCPSPSKVFVTPQFKYQMNEYQCFGNVYCWSKCFLNNFNSFTTCIIHVSFITMYFI